MSKIHIGTSGWVYKSWHKIFYPEGLHQKKELEFYAKEFLTVEINSSYYHLPSPSSYQKWATQVPSSFVFSVKASRFLTHMKRLKDPANSWQLIISGAQELKSKLGPILLQFPQSWEKNYDRLLEFFEMLKHSQARIPSLVFEFRNDSWFSSDIFKLLEKHEATLCIADSYKFQRKEIITSNFVYYRFHGRQISEPLYTFSELRKEATKMKQLANQGIDVFVYFNNDTRGYAIKNARTLCNYCQ